jgi:hypothetical protein
MIASLAPVDILAVFAHPDYETFASGTFTKLSANGQRIQLVYATSGHAGGDLTGQGLKGEALAAFLPQLETLQAIFISSLSYAEASLCETRCFFIVIRHIHIIEIEKWAKLISMKTMFLGCIFCSYKNQNSPKPRSELSSVTRTALSEKLFD